MKAYIKNNQMPSLYERGIDHSIECGYLKTIEVAEIGETLHRKILHSCVLGESTYKYQPVTHREVDDNPESRSLGWQAARIADLEKYLENSRQMFRDAMDRKANLEKENAELKKKIGVEVETSTGSGVFVSWHVLELEKEKAELRKEKESLENRWRKNLDTLSDKMKEIERLKKGQVVWENQNECMSGSASMSDTHFTVYVHGKKCTIPLPPQEKDEAEEAWEEECKLTNYTSPVEKEMDKKMFFIGYRAAQKKGESK